MTSSGPREDVALAGSPLLAAKLSAPLVRTPVVRRPRLLELVDRGVTGPLTVVAGAAGAGKTVLLASWVRDGHTPGPVAWVNLDDSDDQPGVFWTYVVASLRRAGVAFPADVGRPMRPDHIDQGFLARVADALAHCPEPVVLVLDQIDLIADAEIKRGLAFVLRHATPTLRLVMLSRDAVPIPLHRFELSGELTRIDGAALAFSPREAEALLHQHGVRLPAGSLDRLLDQVGGWAAALRLSAVAMQRRVHPEDFVDTLPVSDATLSGFLVDEVLGTQSEEIRRFLLQTSVVESICPPLADALTGRSDGAVVLAALHTGNVLTDRLDDRTDWYHYHPLFRRLLRAELDRRFPGLAGELHRRAAAWFERAGMTVEAVEAAAAGEDWQQAAAAVVRGLGAGALLTGGESSRLDAALARLPAGEAGPMPAAVRAARAMARFDLDACHEELAIVEREPPTDPEAAAPVIACTAVVRAIVARAEGDVDAAEAALADGERALARIPERAAQHPEMLALLLSNAGTAQMWAGRFAAAEDTLRRGLAASDRPGCEYPRHNILGRLAGLEFRNGRLRRAARLGQDALSLAEESGLPVQQRTGAGHVALAMVAVEWADRAATQRHLEAAERTVGARHDPFVATIVPLLRAWQQAAVRDFRRALAALASVPTEIAGRPLPPWLAARVAMAEAGIQQRRGDVRAAAAALERVAEHGPEWAVSAAGLALATGERERAGRLLAAVLDGSLPDVDATRAQGWLLQARICLDEGHRPAALEALGRALALARPEGYRRTFVESGPWLRELLRSAPALAAANRWLGAPLVDSAVGAPADGDEDGPPVVVETLTERERTVLERLAQGLSAEDVARDLYLSINTVKTHQKSLYRKLGVARRNEAVRRARQLNLL